MFLYIVLENKLASFILDHSCFQVYYFFSGFFALIPFAAFLKLNLKLIKYCKHDASNSNIRDSICSIPVIMKISKINQIFSSFFLKLT